VIATSPHRQRGTALVVGMIMLVLITLMLITALNLGTTNFRAVSNMQYRSEAIAAANAAIEQVAGSPFTDDPAAETIAIDMDVDGDADYQVQVTEPACVSAKQASSAEPSSVSLPPSMSLASTWITVWEVAATVDEASNAGGADVQLRSGIRVLLPQADKDVVCP
jgi:Tfp pilus assembly protein PilV